MRDQPGFVRGIKQVSDNLDKMTMDRIHSCVNLAGLKLTEIFSPSCQTIFQ